MMTYYQKPTGNNSKSSSLRAKR